MSQENREPFQPHSTDARFAAIRGRKMGARPLALLFSFLTLTAFSFPLLDNAPRMSVAYPAFRTQDGLVIVQHEKALVLTTAAFSIPAGGTVEVRQPDSSSVLVVRVDGSEPTTIAGSLRANGRVVLENRNGFFFGPDSIITTASFAATTVSWKGAGGTGPVSILQSGTITAAAGASVYLSAPSILSRGTIKAPGGKIVLGDSGPESQPDELPSTAVLGRLEEPWLASVAAHEAVSELAQETVVNGELDVSDGAGGSKGGEVRVIGRSVVVGGRIDARGTAGGGIVLIGGGLRGADRDMKNSQTAMVMPNAVVLADALESGYGGTVVIWSETATSFDGRVSARGGPREGDGGFTEVSTRGTLRYEGQSDLRAFNGTTGTLLLDPTNITISTAGNTGTMTWNGVTFSDTTTTPSNLNTGTLQGQLAASNVIVTTASGRPAAGTIVVANAVSWASGNSLVLTANSTIAVNAGATITNTGTGGLTFNATAGVSIAAAITLSGGAFASNGTTFNNTGGSITTSGGNITINHSSTVTVGAALNAGAGYVSITSNGAISQTATITSTAGGLVLLGTGAATLTLANPVGTVAVNRTGGAVSLTTSAAVVVGTVNATSGVTTGGQNFTLKTNAGGITISRAINAGAGYVSLNPTASGVTQTAIITSTAGGLELLGVGPDTLTLSNPVGTVAVNTTGGAVSLTTSAAVVVGTVNATSGVITGGQNFTLKTNAGGITISQAINAGAGYVSLNPTASGVTQTATITSTAGGLELLGVGPDTLTLSNPVGTVAVNTTGGAVSLTTSAAVVVGTVNATSGVITGGQNFTLKTNAGGITISQAINAGAGYVSLNPTASGVTQTATITSTAGGLELLGVGPDTLTLSNPVGTVAVNTTGGAVSLTTSAAVVVGTVNATSGVITGGQNFTLKTNAGGITISQAINAGAGYVSLNPTASGVTQTATITSTAGGLELLGVGPDTLTLSNPVGTVAVNTTGGAVSLTTSAAVVVGTVNATSGVTTGGQNFTLKTNAGGITISRAINAGAGYVSLNPTASGVTQTATITSTAGGLELLGVGPDTLTLSNPVGTVAVNTTGGAVSLTTSAAVVVGTVNATSGVITGGQNFTLKTNAGGITISQGINAGAGYVSLNPTASGVTQTATITSTAGGLELLGVGPDTLTLSNPVGTVAVNTTGGAVSLTTSAAVVVGTVNATSGVITGGQNFTLKTNAGGITISQAINAGAGYVSLNPTASGVTQTATITSTAGGLELSGVGPDTLTLSNPVGTVAVNTTGGAVSLTTSAAVVVGTVNATSGVTTGGQNFTLKTSAGGITISRAINAGAGYVSLNPTASGVTQTATITSTAGGLELLGVGPDTLTLSNPVGTVAVNTTGGAVSLTTSAAAVVGTVNATSGVTTGGQNFTLKTNAGGITISQAINAGAGYVSLNPTASGVTQTATITSTAGGLELLGVGPDTLTLSNPVGTVAVNTTGGAVSLTTSAAVVVGTVNATSGVTTGGQNFTLVTNAGGITISQAINAGAGYVSLNPTASGVTQTAIITSTAGGLELLGVGPDTLTLSNPVGTVAVNTTGGAVSITTSAAVAVGTVNATTGVNTTGQDFTLSTNANGITLSNGVTATGATVTLSATSAGVSGGGAIGAGTLSVTSTAGNINLTGTQTITGNSTFTANGAGATITANGASNNFSGTVGFAGTGGLASVTVVDTTAFDIQAVTVTGALTLTAGGVVTQSGVISCASLVVKTLNGAGAAITLDTSVNTAGTIDLRARNAADTANAAGAIAYQGGGYVVATVATAANATLNTTGAVTQTGLITASGLELLGTAGYTLTLSNPVGTVAVNTTGGAVSLTTSAAAVVGTVNATSGVTTGGQNFTLKTNAGGITISQAINAGAGYVSLNPTASGVTQTATITSTAGGLELLGVGPDTLTLSNPVGTVAVNTTGGAVSLTTSAAVVVGTVNATSGVTTGGQNFTLVTNAGGITISQAINAGAGYVSLNPTASGVTQTAIITSTAGGLELLGVGPDTLTLSNPVGTVAVNTTGGAVSITTSAAVAVGTVNATTGVNTTGQDFTLSTNANGITLSNGVTATGATVTLSATSAGVSGGGAIGAGTLSVTSTAGNINLTGTQTITGNSTFTANGAGATITANGASNNFSGTVGFAGTGGLASVTVVDTTAFDIQAVTVTGALTLTAGGVVTQSGVISCASLVVKTLNGAGAAITLDTSVNTAGTIDLRARNAADTANAAGAIAYQGGAVALSVGAIATTANLTLTTSAAVTQTGAVTVGGTSGLAAGAANDITFNNAGNSFTGAVTLTSVNNATLVDSIALSLGASTISGTLSATGAGITQTGALDVSSTSSLTAGANDINLNNSGNILTGAITINSGANVTIEDSVVLDLAAPTNVSSVSLTAAAGITLNGNVTTSGGQTYTGPATLAAACALSTTAGGNIQFTSTITGSSNNLSLVPHGGTATVTSTASGINVLTLQDNTAASTGTITFSDAVSATSLTTYAQPYSITLSNGGTLTNAATFNNTGPLTISAGYTFSGGVTATAPSTSNVAGTITTAGAATISFGTTVATGNCTLSPAAGPIVISGNLTIDPLVTFDPSNVDIQISGNWTNNGTYTAGASATVTFNGAVAQSVNPGGSSFTNLTKSTPSVASTLTVNTNPLTVTGTLTVSTANDTVDVGSLDFTLGTLTGGGTFALSGVPAQVPAITTVSGATVQYYGAAGGAVKLSSFYSFAIAAGSGTFALQQPITVGPVTGGGTLTINGGVLDSNGFDITIHGTWTNNVGTLGFLAGTRTVLLATTPVGATFAVNGTTAFYHFQCTDPGATINFSGTLFISTGGDLTLTGSNASLATYIKLNPPPYAGPQWNIILQGTAQVVLSYVDVFWSSASTSPIVIPVNVIAVDDDPLEPTPHHDTAWLNVIFVTSSQVEDADHNGKIDRILVKTQAAITSPLFSFSGFVANVRGYTVTGYADAGIDQFGGAMLPPSFGFYIFLKENTVTDTHATPSWTIVSQGTVVDSATGKRHLAIQTPPAQTTDAASPIIGYTLAVVGQSQMFIHFSEPLVQTGGGPLDTTNFSFATTTTPVISATTVTAVTSSPSGVSEVVVTLSRPLTADDFYPNPVTVTVGNARDAAGLTFTGATPGDPHRTVGSDTHRITDIALGPVGAGFYQPVWAKDQTNRAATPGVGYVTQFDGSAWLRNDQKLTLEANITPLAGFPVLGATSMIFDIGVPAGLRNGAGLWLPPFTDDTTTLGGFSGLVPTGAAGDPAPTRTTLSDTEPTGNQRLRDFQINPQGASGTLGFLFSIPETSGPPLFAARVVNPAAADWYRHITPWTFDLHSIVPQRGGVQILNNVINPDKGQVATLQYALAKGGAVTVTVFDLSGSVINVLVRGTQSTGEYELTWDGKNRGHAAVTRGIYFVRIVAPGIDEIRKVLVVR